MDLGTLGTLGTETRNERTAELDRMPVSELLSVMNAEDRTVALAVRDALPEIGSAVVMAVEGAEDQPARAIADLDETGVNDRDTVVGLAAGGRTPYVVGGLKHAAAKGAVTVSVACNRDAVVSRYADIPIEVPTGPEILTGSTRLKAGTAEKMVCNMLSTASMVRLGKVYGNLMVDVRAGNDKLVDRARRMVVQATGADSGTAAEALRAAGGHAKTAVAMLLAHCTAEEAVRRLDQARGDTRAAVGCR
nr:MULTISPECIES: N-acetylmuramic acid 6-phosphate etherase [unclassified Streptomyces]